MQQIVLVLHVLIAISLISLVLLQHGKGADVGAAFGSGASNTLFGSRGSSSFLFKLTAGLAMLFFVTSIVLTHLAASHLSAGNKSFMGQTTTVTQPAKIEPAPAVPGAPATPATDRVVPAPAPAVPVGDKKE